MTATPHPPPLSTHPDPSPSITPPACSCPPGRPRLIRLAGVRPALPLGAEPSEPRRAQTSTTASPHLSLSLDLVCLALNRLHVCDSPTRIDPHSSRRGQTGLARASVRLEVLPDRQGTSQVTWKPSAHPSLSVYRVNLFKVSILFVCYYLGPKDSFTTPKKLHHYYFILFF